MNETGTSRSPRLTPLVLILLAAVVQGWALYGLHLSLNDEQWLATHPPLLLALYTIALFVPTTLQLLSEHAGNRLLWLFVVGLGLLFGYFGWHHGLIVSEHSLVDGSFEGAELGAPLVVLWLMLLPFLATRMRRGKWSADYPDFFTTAWRNKLLLAEAALFTIVFWLLLALWATLFGLLNIDFFQELFREPIFIYPVTALVFGLALYLIGSVERFVGVVLEQILGLFKWLAVIAGLILVLFSIALIFKLPGLIGSGVRIINAAWLLWLVAVMILLLNAAYRDGSGARPYPAIIAATLRYIVPAMLLVALVALYSLGVRISEYGLTTGRFWAVIVSVAALAYAGGYSFSAFRPGVWMGGMGRINVSVAVGLMIVIGLAMTPILSPYRLAANSQYARIVEGRAIEPVETSERQGRLDDSYRVLRFDMGRYGRDRLQTLAELKDHPEAEQIRDRAKVALNLDSRWAPATGMPLDVERIEIFPAGRILEPGLLALLNATAPDGGNPALVAAPVFGCSKNDLPCAGLFVDLDADGVDEFVLFTRSAMSFVFVNSDDTWSRAPDIYLPANGAVEQLVEALRKGDFGTEASRYRDLRIGDRVYQINGGQGLRVIPPTAGAQ